jgi:hypothetical protein
MSRLTHHYLSDRVCKIAQARWLWRAAAIVAMLVAGFISHQITLDAPLAAHAPVSPSTVVAPNRSEAPGSQQPQRFPESAEPYAADHLDAHFVDFAHPEPLTQESIREMALTQFLGLSLVEREEHASR